jgi:hypothetical protein
MIKVLSAIGTSGFWDREFSEIGVIFPLIPIGLIK